MPRQLIWKLLLILGISALCGLAIKYQGVKYGLDLVGGTTLVYEVDVPEGQAVRPALEQTIQVLQERVDPAGVRNMVWRIQGGNRIEIQMAAAPKETSQKRSEYLAQQESLFKDNLNLQDLDALLALPESARQKKIVEMAAGRESIARLLIDLDAANQSRQAARQPYAHLQEQVNQLDASISALPSDAPESQKQALKAKQEKLLAELIEKAKAYRLSQQKYDESHQALTKVNLDPSQVSRILLLPTKGTNPENPKDPAYNPRQSALKGLIDQHPDKAESLTKLAQIYEQYEKVKGTLDDPNDLMTLLRGSGVLEFRIVPTANDVPDVDQYRQTLRERGPQAGADKPYRWFQLDKPESWAKGATPAASKAMLEAMQANPAAFFQQHQGLIAEGYGDRVYMLLSDMPQSSLTKRQSDWQLAMAHRDLDELGRPAVSFRLNVVGGQYMGALTGSHVNKQMAIVLDGRIMSAPRINSRIAGSGIITGGEDGFSQQELDYLIRTFNAGSLKAKLSDNPISIQQIGATFGQDNLQAGLKTVVWSMIVVCGFMAVYYFFWGMVANAAMLLNILFLLGIMAMFEATFTLPGIAGVVLTIGMAVDANVLIYERIREEIERKADLKTAVRLGFDRAFVTILDSNLTTALTCWVLYGCPPFDKVVDIFKTPADIKGFGVALGIGVIANLFTGVFCTRVFIELWLAIFKPKKLPMLALVFPGIRRFFTPNINWFGLRWVFLSITGILGILGIVSMILRGPDFLDIEFRGGTQVTFNLASGKTLSQKQARQLMEEQIPTMQQTLSQQQAKLKELLAAAGTAEARTAIQKELTQVEHDLSVAPQFAENVLTMGELTGSDQQARSFVIATLLTDPKTVSQNVKQAFSSVLDTTRPLSFASMGEPDQVAPGMADAPVYAVRSGVLGENLQRAKISSDVRPFIGGAVVLLDRLTPATTEADIKQRIDRMKYQDKYQALGYRNIQVVGLDWARDKAGQPMTSGDGQPLFTSVAVLGHDGQTNYVERPENFQDAGGLADTHWQLVRDAMLRDTSLGSITSFSPQVSASMTGQALIAIVLSWLAILIYVWFRFRDIRFGVGAIVALIHDVVIAVGLAAAGRYVVEHSPLLAQGLMIEPFRLNLAMIAASLTLIGYSVNDTIVIFDRIRENRGKLDYITPRIINDSVNQTISRTILTAGTVFIAVLILYVMGGPGVHGFAFVMLIGCVVGCYSSIAIASPILLVGIDHTKLPDVPSHTTVVSSIPPAAKA